MRGVRLGCIVAVALLAAIGPAAVGQTYEWRPGEAYPGANGTLEVVMPWDPDGDGPQPEKLVIGGGFSVMGNVVTSGLATWDGSRWEKIDGGIGGVVYTLTVHNGQLVAGGSFTTAGGTACANIARWDGAAWQPFDGGLYNGYSQVFALKEYNGQLYAGGTFIQGGITPCRYIGRWDGTAWQMVGTGLSNGSNAGSVTSMVIYNGKLIVSGGFTTAGGVACSNIASWDGTTWAPLDGGLAGGGASALLVHNGELYAAGGFTAAGGVAGTKGIARWNGTTWQAVSGGLTTGSSVYSLTVYNGQLVAGGNFTAMGGVACRYMATWTGSAWQPVGNWVSEVNNAVRSVTVYNGELIACGRFNNAGGVLCVNIARWNGTIWQPLATGMNGNVNALVVHNGQLVAGGAFTTAAGGAVCNYIARKTESGWEPLGTGMNGAVNCLAVHNGELYAGGMFTTAGGANCKYVARWDGTAWQPLDGGLGNAAYAMTTYNGQLVVGGAFSTAGGLSCKYVATWNGTTWQPVDGGMNNTVHALAVYNGELIAGGYFTTAGTTTVNKIARWNGSTWQGFGTGMNNTVYALTVFEGDLIAGGDFSTANGVPACYSLARWNGSNWSPMSQTNGGVRAFTIYNNELYCAGTFGAASVVAARTVARWDGTAWRPMAGGLNGPASYALAVHDGELVVGGSWQATYDGKASAFWARWGPVEPVIIEQPVSQEIVQGQGVTFSVKAIGAATLAYQWFKGGIPVVDGGAVSGANAAALTISAVATGDEGDYSCIVTNASGFALSDDAHLTVLVPAAIVTQPVGQAVQAGQAVTLSVEAIGTQPLAYQWRKDGVVIDGATSATLTISAVEVADAGSYDVVVSNAYGTETSEAVAISVLPTIVTQPVGATVVAPNAINLSVAAVGSGTLSYQWRKDGVAIDGATGATLTIDPSAVADSGSYDVVITTECGSATSEAAIVTVAVPPAIVTQPVGNVYIAGRPVTLSVVASGSGTLSYQWRKDGAALADDARVSGSTAGTLTIDPCQVSDSGSYDVVVTSEYGTATSEAAAVTVLVPLAITAQPVSQTVELGDPVAFSVTATGADDIVYQWRKDGVAIDSATGSTLTIDAAGLEDAGVYDVLVSCASASLTSDAATLAIQNAQATPAGSSVSVSLSDPNTGMGATVTFQNVTSPGLTAVTTVTPSEQQGPPSGFKFGNPPVLYQLETTAVYSGTIEVCFDYSGISFLKELKLKLFHFDGGSWVNVTTSKDIFANRICGTVSHFSLFGVFEQENTAPAVTITGPATGHVQAVNMDVTLSATISDPDEGESHTATWTVHDDFWGDQVIEGTVSGATVQNVIQLAGAGIYHITLSVTDADGAIATADTVNGDVAMPAFVVIYDPTGGAVTGGGWILSPAGALKWTPEGAALAAEGKATFGFNSKYHHGASVPTGNTEFQFQAGNFRFKSTAYEWLVVAGNKAMYRGVGEIRGVAGTYGFQLTGVDDSSGDRFRIKIWDEATEHVIYDNKRGQDDSVEPTLIGGGSIQIHK